MRVFGPTNNECRKKMNFLWTLPIDELCKCVNKSQNNILWFSVWILTPTPTILVPIVCTSKDRKTSNHCGLVQPIGATYSRVLLFPTMITWNSHIFKILESWVVDKGIGHNFLHFSTSWSCIVCPNTIG